MKSAKGEKEEDRQRRQLQEAYRRVEQAARRTNSSTLCVANLFWSDADKVIKKVNDKDVDFFLVTAPWENDPDTEVHSWSDGDERRMSDVKGASWDNQIKVWKICPRGDKYLVDLVTPRLPEKVLYSDLLCESRVPEFWTNFGLHSGIYNRDGDVYVAFRQYYEEMGEDALPILRCIPAEKLLVNIQEGSDKFYRIRQKLLSAFDRRYHEQILANFGSMDGTPRNGLSKAEMHLNAFKLVKYFNKLFGKRERADKRKWERRQGSFRAARQEHKKRKRNQPELSPGIGNTFGDMDLGDSEAKSKKSLESYFTAMDENPVDQNSSELSDSSTDPVLSADEVSLLLRNGPPSCRSSSSVPKNQMAHGSGALKLMSLSSEWTLKHPDKAVLISSDSANDASPVDCKRPCNLSQSSSSRAMLNFPPTIVGDVIIPYTLLEICGAITSDRTQDLFTPSVLRQIYKTIKKRCLQWMHVGGDLQSAVQEEYTIARIPTKFFRSCGKAFDTILHASKDVTNAIEEQLRRSDLFWVTSLLDDDLFRLGENIQKFGAGVADEKDFIDAFAVVGSNERWQAFRKKHEDDPEDIRFQILLCRVFTKNTNENKKDADVKEEQKHSEAIEARRNKVVVLENEIAILALETWLGLETFTHNGMTFKVTTDVRTWTMLNVYKEEEDIRGGTLPQSVTLNAFYTILLAWEKFIQAKYLNYLASDNKEYCESTWSKWRLRFVRNNDETNALFLECLKKMGSGKILFSSSPMQEFNVQTCPLGLDTWNTMRHCWQEDLQDIFEKVLKNEIAWKDVSCHHFLKSKHRFAVMYFFDKLVNGQVFRELSPNIQQRLRIGPQELVKIVGEDWLFSNEGQFTRMTKIPVCYRANWKQLLLNTFSVVDSEFLNSIKFILLSKSSSSLTASVEIYTPCKYKAEKIIQVPCPLYFIPYIEETNKVYDLFHAMPFENRPQKVHICCGGIGNLMSVVMKKTTNEESAQIRLVLVDVPSSLNESPENVVSMLDAVAVSNTAPFFTVVIVTEPGRTQKYRSLLQKRTWPISVAEITWCKLTQKWIPLMVKTEYSGLNSYGKILAVFCKSSCCVKKPSDHEMKFFEAHKELPWLQNHPFLSPKVFEAECICLPVHDRNVLSDETTRSTALGEYVVTRWKGDQKGNILVPYGIVGTTLQGIITSNQEGDLWINDPKAEDESFIVEELKKYQQNMHRTLCKDVKMPIKRMLVREIDQGDLDTETILPQISQTRFNFPPAFFKSAQFGDLKRSNQPGCDPLRVLGPKSDRFVLHTWWLKSMGDNPKEPLFVPAPCPADIAMERIVQDEEISLNGEILSLTSQNLRGKNTSRRPVVPHRWALVNFGNMGPNGEKKHEIIVKVKPDQEWVRLTVVAASMVPVHLIDIYSRKFKIRDAKFIVRILVFSNLDTGFMKGGPDFVKEAWANINYRKDPEFRSEFSAVVILTGEGYSGMFGFENENVYFPIKSVIKEIMRGDNDVIIRHFLNNWDVSDFKEAEEFLNLENLSDQFDKKLNDILIEALVENRYHPIHRVDSAEVLLCDKIRHYDLVEDFLNRWARIEDAAEHEKRWGLEGGRGGLMVRDRDEEDFDVEDESLMTSVGNDLLAIYNAKFYAPEGYDKWTDEEKDNYKKIDKKVSLLESMIRCAYRQTDYFYFESNSLGRKFTRDWNYEVLGEPLIPDGKIHEAVVPRTWPFLRPYNNPNSWHHRRTGELVEGPSKNNSNGDTYETMNVDTGATEGDVLGQPEPESVVLGGNHTYTPYSPERRHAGVETPSEDELSHDPWSSEDWESEGDNEHGIRRIPYAVPPQRECEEGTTTAGPLKSSDEDDSE